jgi:hypothetical protein
MEKVVRRKLLLVSSLVILAAEVLPANVSEGFSWVSIETDQSTMAVVRRAVNDASITAIREVGVKGGFAIVMAVSREEGAPTPDYDLWSIYNVSMTTGTAQILVSGYGVKLLDWIGRSSDELAITYYSCWECEATTIFTTLHFKPGVGWGARWLNKGQDVRYPQPGAVALSTDIGEPYDDREDVDQVFAVVTLPNNDFAVGYWLHSRNSNAGKPEDDVERYSIDSPSGKDSVETLVGPKARAWERQLCTRSDILPTLSSGQNTKACRSVVQPPVQHKGIVK